jgi:hypothetical protein
MAEELDARSAHRAKSRSRSTASPSAHRPPELTTCHRKTETTRAGAQVTAPRPTPRPRPSSAASSHPGDAGESDCALVAPSLPRIPDSHICSSNRSGLLPGRLPGTLCFGEAPRADTSLND